jgi:hypothetical protein
MVSYDRFNKHCELHPVWAVDAWRISRVNGNLGKGSRLHKMTEKFCLKGLHAMVGSNVRIDPSTGWRACLACRYIARDNPPLITPDVLVKIRKALEAGASQSQICNGHPVGGGKKDKSLILTTNQKFYQQRRLDPEFDRFVIQALADSSSTGQRLRQSRLRGDDGDTEAECRADMGAFDVLIETAPTTLAGLVAWAAYLDEVRTVEARMFEEQGPAMVVTLVEALGNLAVTS